MWHIMNKNRLLRNGPGFLDMEQAFQTRTGLLVKTKKTRRTYVHVMNVKNPLAVGDQT